MVVASSIYSFIDMHFYVTDICIKVIQELSGMILTRGPKLCNIVEWRGFKVVYRRYAGLYFCMCVNHEDNELEILEIIQYFVETLNRYFGSVCELDLIFHFHQTYYILDEILIAGELQESSKTTVHRLIDAQVLINIIFDPVHRQTVRTSLKVFIFKA
ncbi:putative adaptor protein complex, sigma subunit [Helianthus annuus]|nr:putative adaptor protein complex, sigma subunit [Helianthus annuus]